jgi:hypothetical protein
MPIKIRILSGYKSLFEQTGDLLVRDEDPPLKKEFTHHLSVIGDYLGDYRGSPTVDIFKGW